MLFFICNKSHSFFPECDRKSANVHSPFIVYCPRVSLLHSAILQGGAIITVGDSSRSISLLCSPRENSHQFSLLLAVCMFT